MRFGPTSLRLSGVLAKGLRRPQLRDDLIVSEQVIGGETSYLIKIPKTDLYLRYQPLEFEVLHLCDGTRTAADITAAMNERYPDQPLSQEEVMDFLDNIDPNTWERSLGEKNLAILEKIRDERKTRVESSSLLYLRFGAWNPDKLLARIHPYLRWMYTRGFVIFCLILYSLTIVIIASDWQRIRDDTVEFYSFTHKTAYDLWIFWVLTFFISLFHEFGHGLTCKHYGGEVSQMGVLLIYFTPAFYTEVTDMYLFDRTSKRLWTIFAGIWIELLVCALATFIWFLSPPGSFIGDLGYKMLLLTGVSGVFINVNPLMKLDGYYALCQYLQIDSLREDSFEYLKAWLRRMVLRQEVDLPPASRRRRRIFLLYGTAAFLYGVLVMTVILVFVKNVFTKKFGDWGYVLAAAVAYLLLRKRLVKLLPGLLPTLREGREKLMALRLTRLQWAGALVVVGLLTLPPTRTTTTTEFLLEPGQRAEVRAPVPGLVSEVRVREGEYAEAGAVLAVLRNPEVEAHAAVAEQQRELAERSLLAAQARGDMAEIQKYTQERQRLEAESAEANRKRRDLVLRAPLAGVVTTPQIEQRVGEYLLEGDTLAALADRRTMRARVLVRDWELEDVREADPVKLNSRAFPFRTFSGTVQQIMPAAALDRPLAEPHKRERKGQEITNYFAITLEISNADGVLQEGMTGSAKIYGRRYPLLWRAGRSTWRWLRSQVW